MQNHVQARANSSHNWQKLCAKLGFAQNFAKHMSQAMQVSITAQPQHFGRHAAKLHRVQQIRHRSIPCTGAPHMLFTNLPHPHAPETINPCQVYAGHGAEHSAHHLGTLPAQAAKTTTCNKTGENTHSIICLCLHLVPMVLTQSFGD